MRVIASPTPVPGVAELAEPRAGRSPGLAGPCLIRRSELHPKYRPDPRAHIARAMTMVSAAKLRRAQERVIAPPRPEHNALLILMKPSYAETAALAQKAIAMFCEEQIDAVYIICNQFKSVVSQKLTVTIDGKPAYLFEHPPAEMLHNLLPRYVETGSYRALLETAASGHAARMTAMEAATSNASDVIERLTLYMSRVRTPIGPSSKLLPYAFPTKGVFT